MLEVYIFTLTLWWQFKILYS